MDIEATAFHEAGHAWAYRLRELPLRYVTTRPRDGSLGICRPWKPRRIDPYDAMFTASAGPVAQAIWSQQMYPDDGYDWHDYLVGAVLCGGHDDLSKANGMLDSPSVMEWMRGEQQRHWPAISALAQALIERHTLSGRDAFSILAG